MLYKKHRINISIFCKVVYLAVILVMLSGCDSNFMLPEELIQKPALDDREKAIKELVTPLLTNYQLILPNNIDKSGAINFVELTGDDTEEMVIIYEDKDRVNSISIKAFKETEEGYWQTLDTIKSEEKELFEISFSDLNKDGKSEVIIQWNDGEKNKKLVEIYAFRGKEFKKVFGEKFLNLNLIDLDDDGTEDLILFNYDGDKSLLSISLYEFNGNEVVEVNDININSKDKSEKGYMNLEVGNVTETKKGMLIDISGEDLSGYTAVIVKQNGKLMNIYQNSDLHEVGKKSLLNSKDIDDDGILEMGVLTPQVNEGYDLEDTTPLIQKWYQWDGYKDVIFEKDIFYDHSLKYSFEIPHQWKDKYIVDTFYGDLENYAYFYESTGYPMEKREMLRVCIIKNQKWSSYKEELESSSRSYIYLGQNNDYTYIAMRNEVEVGYDKEMIINDDIVMRMFNKFN